MNTNITLLWHKDECIQLIHIHSFIWWLITMQDNLYYNWLLILLSHKCFDVITSKCRPDRHAPGHQPWFSIAIYGRQLHAARWRPLPLIAAQRVTHTGEGLAAVGSWSSYPPVGVTSVLNLNPFTLLPGKRSVGIIMWNFQLFMITKRFSWLSHFFLHVVAILKIWRKLLNFSVNLSQVSLTNAR